MKQAILVRDDLKLPKGKMCAQVGHAAVEAVMKSEDEDVEEWRSEGGMKIVVKVRDERELMEYLKHAKQMELTVALIKDAGHTVVEPGTITVLGVGPDQDNKIDKLIKDLKLM
jgi:peptidyl-tRNA hydrolase, PTH2 family